MLPGTLLDPTALSAPHLPGRTMQPRATRKPCNRGIHHPPENLGSADKPSQVEIVIGQMPDYPFAHLENDVVAAQEFPPHEIETELGDLLDDLIVSIHMPCQLVTGNNQGSHHAFFAGEVIDKLAGQP